MSEAFDAYYKWLGIPPKDQPPNHYRLLGVELYESDAQVIDLACDRQVRHVRTFQMGKYSEHSQRLLDELASARDCLLHPKDKAAYDAELKQKLDAAAEAKAEGVRAVPPPRMPSIIIGDPAKPLVKRPAKRGWLVPVGAGVAVLAAAGLAIMFSMPPPEEEDTTDGTGVPAAESVNTDFASSKTPDQSTTEKPAPAQETKRTTPPTTAGKQAAPPANSRSRQNDPVLERPLDLSRDRDLLATIDPQRDARGKDWRLDGKVLVSPSAAAVSRLRIPGRFPEEFALTIVAERPSAAGLMQLALGDGKELKLITVDDSHWKTEAAESDGAPDKSTGKRSARTLTLVVKKTELQLKLDGDDFLKAPNTMDVPPAGTPVTRQVSLFVKDGEFRVSQLTLSAPSAPESSSEPAGDTVAKTTPPAGPDNGGKPAAMKPVEPEAPVEKLPVPGADELSKADKEIKDVFKDDFSRAKTPSEKMVLASTLLKQALATRDNPAMKYVLLQYARDLAAQGVDIRSALDAVEVASATFDIDEWDYKVQVLTTASKQSMEPSAKQALLDTLVDLLESCVDREQFDAALKLGNLVNSMVTKHRDPSVRKRLTTRVIEIKKLRGMWAAVQESPDDPSANLRYSKYLCCTKGDWERGLPLMAKSGDAKLAPIAQTDLKAPTTPEDRSKLGDAWWDVSQSVSQSEAAIKKGLQSRAGYWYEKAIPDMTGLNKARLEKRLGSIDRTPLPAATVRSSPGTGPGTPTQPGPGRGGAPAPANTPPKSTDDRGIAGQLVDSGVHVSVRAPQINLLAKTRDELPKVPFQVVAVSIPEDSTAGDAALGPLDGLGALDTLELSGPQITDAGLILASRAANISNLTIGAATKITDKGLEVLGRLPKLVILRLRGSRFTNTALQHVGKAANLRFLELTELKLSGDGLRPLAALAALQQLQFKQLALADNDLSHLAALSKLQQLSFDEVPITGEGFRHLKGLTGIQSLGLPRTKITTAGIQQIVSFPALQNLDLSETQVTGDGMQLLRGVVNLRSLQLNSTPITDQDLAKLAGSSNLRNLQLRLTQITGEGFKQFAEGFPELRNLSLEQAPITNDGLREIVAKVPKLNNINLNLTRVTDAGLAHLQKLDNLNRLQLVGTQISEKGLEQLRGLSQLRNVELPEGRISESAVEKLQQALPQCTVQRN